MTEQDDYPSLPEAAQLVRFTYELLTSSEGDRWREIADNFDPVPEDAGFAMARWLCESVEKKKMPEETYVLCSGDELLGFFRGPTRAG